MVYNEGDEVKEDEMDETHRMHGEMRNVSNI